MNRFHWPRFLRLFSIDLLLQWKSIWIATLALIGMGLVAYLTNVDPRAAVRPAIHVALFPTVLIAGGLLFTSTIFADLHHPLQRFHYLTLPCSNLERFFSRYLLTAPLYYLYVLIVYAAFDFIAGLIANALLDTSAAPFAPFEPRMLQVAEIYFGLHALMFCGAIYFRSFAAVKTPLAVVLIGFGLVVIQLVALRLFYWKYFRTLFMPVQEGIPLAAFNPSPQLLTAAAFALSVWVLYIAYQCLREHEVQG